MPGERFAYQNHAARHAAGGSDPIAGTTLISSFGQATNTTVTTPWTLDSILTLTTFSDGGDSARFALDSSNQGIEMPIAGIYNALVSAQISNPGVGHGIPTVLAVQIVSFTPGSPASTFQICREEFYPAGGLENNFLAGSYEIRTDKTAKFSAGKSLGFRLFASGAADNWRYDAAGLVITWLGDA